MRRLLVIQIVTLVIGLGALLYAVIGVQESRVESLRGARADTCRLIVGLAYAATNHSPRATRQVRAYIARTPLQNCKLYAENGK